MIKDVLAIVETGPACEPAVDAALLFAEQVHAHLGITAVTERLLLMAAFDPMLQSWPDASREEEHRAGVAAIRRQVTIAEVPVDVRGLCDEPAILPSVANLEGRYADIVLIGAPDGWSHTRLRRQVIDAVLLGAGAPVLASPSGWAPSPFTHIVVGWNASQQAARAVRELRHIAAPGAHIDIAIVGAPGPAEQHDPGRDIARHLGRHGFVAEVHEVPAYGRATADALQRFAQDRGAQLLVLGAYAHARFREAVLGGVTRHAIEHTEIATLLVN